MVGVVADSVYKIKMKIKKRKLYFKNALKMAKNMIELLDRFIETQQKNKDLK